MKRCTYLLPIRRTSFSENEANDLAAYFVELNQAGYEILVIDGSLPEIFDKHHEVWSSVARHEKVDRRFGYLNDKVNGVHTGVDCASSAKIILADDDIRYTMREVEQICAWLDDFEVVRPQNYFGGTCFRTSEIFDGVEIERGRAEARPSETAVPPPDLTSSSPQDESVRLADKELFDPPSLPWWARMEAARMLINRATLRTADYPGTCAFRRESILRVGHYDGDVLFDNEEIIRHFAAHRVRILYANDFFVQKRAPRFRKWLEQRPRQAYEDFGLRGKTALFFNLLPAALLEVSFFGFNGLAVFVTIVSSIAIALAFSGRRRGQARKYFPWSIVFFAPLWVFERTLSTYWALYWYLRRGGYPFGDGLLSKGIGRDWFEGGRITAKAGQEK
jgi:hypothetical protein